MMVALLCILAVRVVVPQGYMWSTGADGAPEMVVCSGLSASTGVTPLAATALAAQHQSDQRDHDGKTADHPCAFAAAGVAVDLAAEVHPVAVVAPRHDTLAVRPVFVRPGLGLAAPPPPKTGPPLLA